MKSSLLAFGVATAVLLAAIGQTALAQDNAAGGGAAAGAPAAGTPPAAPAATPAPDAAADAAAAGQAPPAGQTPPAGAAPAAGPARTAPAAAQAGARPPAAPALAGTWTGQVTETGHPGPYPVKIIITALAAASDYPDQGCSGKLTRVGTSGKYVFYAEKIAVGAYDEAKGTGCIDGTLTLVRAGNNLLLAWVGEFKGEMIVASGTLALQSPGSQKPPANLKQTAPVAQTPPPVAQTAPAGQKPATSLKPATGKP